MTSNQVTQESIIDTVLSLTCAQPGIPLAHLLHHAKGAKPDMIHSMIVQGQLYVDLRAAPLTEPERCFVFKDKQTATAYRLLILSQASNGTVVTPDVELVRGSTVSFDGKALTIDLVGENDILLRDQDNQPVTLPISTFESLVYDGQITGLKVQRKGELPPEAMEILHRASSLDCEKATARFELIQPYLGCPVPDSTLKARNIRKLKQRYHEAQDKYGFGFLGLIFCEIIKGNRNRKIPEHISEIIDKFINEKYENYKQPNKESVYDAFFTFCVDEEHLPAGDVPSYKTFIKEIKRRSSPEQIGKREGHRAAISVETFCLLLKLTTPPHGERPFEVGHIDHTPLDIELRDSVTGRKLGKAWATFLVDAYSRRLLAIYITFDPPSYRSCLMVLRICFKKYGRLPQNIVVDNGKEFHSKYFRALAGLFEFTLKYRPPSRARFNAVGERLFGTAMTQVIYNMVGNTQSTKVSEKLRKLTKSIAPKELALWTIGLLYLYLLEWADEVYDTTEHPALGRSPREAFEDGLEKYGDRSKRFISYEQVKFLTMPTTDRGVAKVHPRTGVTINYVDYWSDAFRDPEVQQKSVEVRYEPFDSSTAHARIRGRWVECKAYIPSLRGRSEKELALASAALRERNRKYSKNYRVDSKKLGAFLLTIEADEILLEQRLKDGQAKEVFAIIEGGLPNIVPFSRPQAATAVPSVVAIKEDIPPSSPVSVPSNNPPNLTRFGKY